MPAEQLSQLIMRSIRERDFFRLISITPPAITESSRPAVNNAVADAGTTRINSKNIIVNKLIGRRSGYVLYVIMFFQRLNKLGNLFLWRHRKIACGNLAVHFFSPPEADPPWAEK